MKKVTYTFFLIAFGFRISAQNWKINPDIQVDSTIIKIKKSNFEYFAYSSYDNGKSDSLVVVIGSVGTSVTAFGINLQEKPEAYITLYSDYPEYNGKNILNVEFEFYDLEINSSKFEKGDQIMGRISGKSKPIINDSKESYIEIEGEFNHRIGKIMIKREAKEKYRIIDDH
ncbi:hypothetical protein EAX61_15635 [Dokdonia sinensis]|uniref:Uncharacterized protein n=1 Tax=Dokdonia sinensis TaxID=2479847 RepID=A0A3M0FUK9_9FLAO|nr:hypothetical protein [Dokdonia sinensis]RMB56198.1 hypothetical protein EAX61_15635 [Dokdonia sinensis]